MPISRHPFPTFPRPKWKDLLRSQDRPWKTALAVALGAWIGATPVLGLHSWLALTSAAALRIPPLACLLGSNLSNPLTFIPLTLLEIRIGCWILGRPFNLLPSSLDMSDLGPYLLAAWTGFIPVGLMMAAGSGLMIGWILGRRKAQRGSEKGSMSE